MRPIIVATWSKEAEKDKGRFVPPPSPPATPSPTKSSPPSVCFRRRPVTNSLRAREPKRIGDAEEKANAEKSGREQIAEQTQLLKSINEHLLALKEQTERNASTNAAVLVLLTHVLKGENLENGERDAASLLSNSNGSVEKIPATVDSDSKSLASDADIADKAESGDTDI